MLDRIVEVFEVDDFCQAFVPQWEASLLGTGGPPPRGPQPDLSTRVSMLNEVSAKRLDKKSPLGLYLATSGAAP